MKPTITYTESVGLTPFDWNKFLNKSSISKDEWDDAAIRAHKWTTCACGNQCAVIPRDEIGKPDDELLVTLGGDDGFYGAIRGKNAAEAKHFLGMIEIRSSYLIQKQFEKARKQFAEAVEALRAAGFSDEDIGDEFEKL
jgi:hypothetical protein